jgi:hypothetical protein
VTPSTLDPFTLRWVAEFVRMDAPLGDTDADAGVYVAHHFINGYLTALADELEIT